MKEDKLIPKRRFKEFENDDAWEQRKLGEVTNSIDTGRSKFISNSNGKYEVLGSTSIIGYDDNYDYEGDFLLTARVGANAGELYRHSGKVKISDNTVFIQAYNLNFIFYMLMNFDIKRLAFGTGQPLIKASELRELELKLPKSKEERTKIGTFFSNLDNLITLHQRKLKKLKETKSAYLSEMFPKEGEKYPKRRFDGFTDPWEQGKLNTFSEYQSSIYSANQFTDIKPTGNYPVFDANNQIASLNKYDQESAYISIIKDGAGVGRVELRPGKSSIIGTMGYILPKQSDLYFIFTILQKINFTQFISGSTIPHVYYKDYGNAEFFIPAIKEQEKIGTFFNNLDNLITLHQSKLEKLEKLKKAYLNEMFV